MKHLEENENLNDFIKEGCHLIDFYAQWCGPCKMLSPIIEKFDKDIDIVKVDIDIHLDTADQYKIMNVPTLVYVKDGKVIKQVSGFQSEEIIKEDIENVKNS